jgi:hypothetical protein
MDYHSVCSPITASSSHEGCGAITIVCIVMLGDGDILKVLVQLHHDISISQITAQQSDNRARCASSSNSFNSVFPSLLTLWPMSTAILSEPKLPLLHRCSQPRNRTTSYTRELTLGLNHSQPLHHTALQKCQCVDSGPAPATILVHTHDYW